MSKFSLSKIHKLVWCFWYVIYGCVTPEPPLIVQEQPPNDQYSAQEFVVDIPMQLPNITRETPRLLGQIDDETIEVYPHLVPFRSSFALGNRQVQLIFPQLPEVAAPHSTRTLVSAIFFRVGGEGWQRWENLESIEHHRPVGLNPAGMDWGFDRLRSASWMSLSFDSGAGQDTATVFFWTQEGSRKLFIGFDYPNGTSSWQWLPVTKPGSSRLAALGAAAPWLAVTWQELDSQVIALTGGVSLSTSGFQDVFSGQMRSSVWSLDTVDSQKDLSAEIRSMQLCQGSNSDMQQLSVESRVDQVRRCVAESAVESASLPKIHLSPVRSIPSSVAASYDEVSSEVIEFVEQPRRISGPAHATVPVLSTYPVTLKGDTESSEVNVTDPHEFISDLSAVEEQIVELHCPGSGVLLDEWVELAVSGEVDLVRIGGCSGREATRKRLQWLDQTLRGRKAPFVLVPNLNPGSEAWGARMLVPYWESAIVDMERFEGNYLELGYFTFDLGVRLTFDADPLQPIPRPTFQQISATASDEGVQPLSLWIITSDGKVKTYPIVNGKVRYRVHRSNLWHRLEIHGTTPESSQVVLLAFSQYLNNSQRSQRP